MSKKGLVSEFELYRKRVPTTSLVVKREVVDNLMLRNSSEGRAEVERLEANGNEKVLAKSNGEKFVSKERLTGLELLRELTEKYGEMKDWEEDDREGLISDTYLYNEAMDMVESMNMDTLAYGNAGTGDDNFSFKSRVVQGYTYSTREYDITGEEVRNGIKETGTMHDEEMEQSQSLYGLKSIQPQNSFIHFVTLWAGTRSMLQYTLHNLLNTQEYGARETRNGKNVNNKILGLIQSPSKFTLSTREFLRHHHSNDKDIEENLKEYVDDNKNHNWDVHFGDYPSWFEEDMRMASRKEDRDRELYSNFKETTYNAFDKIIEQ